jgi:hypothetical protein
VNLPTADGDPLLLGAVLLPAGLAGVWLWRRVTGLPGFGFRDVAVGLVAASLMHGAAFWLVDVLPRLDSRSVDFSREPDPSGEVDEFILFLEDVDAALPEGESILLVNCRTAVVTDQANYILYPRRVMVRPFSVLQLGDPREEKNDERAAQLRAIGADWVLNLDPRVWRQGAAAALTSLHGSG